MTDVAAGWYPDPTNDAQVRWWDGEAWTEVVRMAEEPVVEPVPEPVYMPPPEPAYIPAPAAAAQYYPPSPQQYAPAAATPEKTKRGCLGTSMAVMFGILGAIVLLAGGCIAVIAMASGGDDDDETVSPLVDGESETDGAAAEKGTIENPYLFGEAHTREAGFLGAGWTISVDEVRSIPKGIFADETDPRTCMAIIVTVTLDSLEGDELTANPFSFPEMAVVDMNGKKSEDGFVECDGAELAAEGITSKYELELTVGGTGRFYDPVLLETPNYQYVAVESTIYGS